MQGDISGFSNAPKRLTRQDYDAWAKSMTVCMLAVQADILLREHARTDPPRFRTNRLRKLCDALNEAGYTGPNFVQDSDKDGYADLRDVLLADELAERWAYGKGITVLRDDDNLFVASQRHVTFGLTHSGLLVPRGFRTRLEAILYALGKHPEAAVAHYPGSLADYAAKEAFVAEESERQKQPLAAPEHVQLQIPGSVNGALNTRGVAHLFEAMLKLCQEEGLTQPELIKALQGGVTFGDDISKDLASIAEKMKKWPAVEPALVQILMKKVYPRLNKELREQMMELFGNETDGFDPLGGGLPPGAGGEFGNDWEPPKQD